MGIKLKANGMKRKVIQFAMKIFSMLLPVIIAPAMFTTTSAQKSKAQNPIIFADVPDLSVVRVGDTYYMSSTTMHMSPGVPIMKSKDLAN